MHNLKLPFNLACLALSQLDQVDYTVFWDTPHPYFYMLPFTAFIHFLICANVSNKAGPIHSWNTAISRFDLKNSRSKWWVGSKVKVILRVQLRINPYAFHFMPSRQPLPEIQQLENLTLKIQDQDHRQDKAKGHIVGHFRFLPIGHPVPEIQPFKKFDLENPMSRSPCGHCNKKFGESVHNPC